jgi:2',3'-cyclic-nucleotide 2'-phosphodiesterase (5'-nucleotidase family)
MKKVDSKIVLALICLLFACGQSKYSIVSVESSRIVMDKSWDSKANPELAALIASYKTSMEIEMAEPVGIASQTLQKGYPQSLLSNFTADAILQFAEQQWSDIDFSIMNMGGLRASLNQGTITVGSLYEVYPFENNLVLLELPGKAVKEFFDFVAFQGGQGLSASVNLLVKNRKVESLQIKGKPLKNSKTYRIATIDFLAEGNDGMVALRKATHMEDSNKQLKDWMIEYVRSLTLNNKEVNARLDNRITIIN